MANEPTILFSNVEPYATGYSGGPLADGRIVTRIHYSDGTVREAIHPAHRGVLVIIPRRGV